MLPLPKEAHPTQDNVEDMQNVPSNKAVMVPRTASDLARPLLLPLEQD